MYYDKKSGSHIPLLIQLLEKTKGPVMEMGMGYYSTPLLHWFCMDRSIQLLSYDNNLEYFKLFKDARYEDTYHKIFLVEDWDKIELLDHYGIVFIDHGPASRRKVDGIRFANIADYVLLHDSDGRNHKHYQYTEVYPHYSSVGSYKKYRPHTAVMSNFYNVKELRDVA